jgi:integrase
MSKQLTPYTPPASPALPTARAARVRKYVEASKAANTIRAYCAQWGQFERHCSDHAAQSLPASVETVIDFLTALAEGEVAIHNPRRPDLHGRKQPRTVAQIEAARAAIGYMHETTGHKNPCKDVRVRETLKGVRRALGAMARPKDHLSPDDLARIVAALPDTLRGKRNKALLLIGEMGAFRRSELVSLDVNNITIRREKGGEVMSILISKSKTDQEGEGLYKTIPAMNGTACPIAAYRAWLKAASIGSGVVFRSIDRWGNVGSGMDGQEVARIVKDAAEGAGLDRSRVAGHSLRSGFVTAAALAGANDSDIMEQTGHRSSATLRRYKQLAGQGAKRATLAAFGQ